MESAKRDLLQGTLDMLILKALALDSMAWAGVLEQSVKSQKGHLRLNPACCFPRCNGWRKRDG
jgi:hypothetical protein